MTIKTSTSAVPGTEAKTVIVPAAVKKEEVNPLRIRDTQLDVLWTIIGLPNCKWTDAAIALLEEHQEPYKRINITPEWHRRLVVEFNTRQLPAVFKGSNFFGCYSNLEAYYKCSFIRDDEKF